ncbi:hypothetical protein BH20ACT18_BH20ACT18_10830 [soil metagenome]
MPCAADARTGQRGVGYSKVVLVLAEVDLPGHRQGRLASKGPEQHVKLTLDIAVSVAGGGNQVQGTLPDLVEAIEPRASATLQQLVKPCRGRIQDHRADNHKPTEEGEASRVSSSGRWGPSAASASARRGPLPA